MTNNNHKKSQRRGRKLGRRGFLGATGAVAAGAFLAPHIWVPNKAIASTAGFGTAKHLIYFRLSGGFRFPTAFNADTAEEFSAWGPYKGEIASGVEWGIGEHLGRPDWRNDTGMNGNATPPSELGLKAMGTLAKQIGVLPCVDHEPLSGSADGNHQTGLERFLTGFVNGPTGIFTMINYGLRARYEAAAADGNILLPAIIMGQAGMGRGSGRYAAYRPPVMRGDDLDRFGFNIDEVLPPWARTMTERYDGRNRSAQNVTHFGKIDGYMQTREATKAYADIFGSEALKIRNGSEEQFDGISNAQLEQIFGDDGTARNIRLGLRLFHFGCPAIYMDQGGYDYHSGEAEGLPDRLQGVARIIAGLEVALKQMMHPEGGTYWDHTIVAFGSEFSRTTRGGRFNSAQGSDHGGDYSTRWMSMPFMGGPVSGIGGRMIGETDRATLEDKGKVFSYRSTMKTLMDALGCEHDEFFEADEPFEDLFG